MTTPQPPRPIRVLCADDHADLCAVLCRIIARQPDMESVGSLASADELVSEAVRLRADVVVVDLTMHGRDPLDAIAELRRVQPETRSIVFSGREDPESVSAALAAGASHMLPKHGDPWAIVDVVRRVARSATT